MRYLPISLLLLSIAGAVTWALALPEPARAEIAAECTIPTAAGPKALALCEVLRVELRIAAADWDRDPCATEFMRRGMRDFARSRARSAAQRTVNGAEQNEVNAFEADHGEGFTRTFCGDGVLQAEYGEVCDDGNDDEADGCMSNCQPSP